MTHNPVINQVLNLDKSQSDIYVNKDKNQVTGCAHIDIGDNGDYICYEFSADVSITNEPGEYWGSYQVYQPTAEIDGLSNLTFALIDKDTDIELPNIDAEVKQMIDDFIISTKIKSSGKYLHFAA